GHGPTARGRRSERTARRSPPRSLFRASCRSPPGSVTQGGREQEARTRAPSKGTRTRRSRWGSATPSCTVVAEEASTMVARLASERPARFDRPSIRRPRVMRPREESEGEERARLRRLRDLAGALLSAESTEAVAEAAVRRIREFLPAAHLSVVVFDHEAEQATVVAAFSVGATKGG